MFFMMVVFTGLAITILSYTVRSPRWHTAVFILGGLAQTGGSVAFIAFTSAAGSWGGHWIPAMILTLAGAEALDSNADGGPVRVHVWQSCLSACVFVGMMVGEEITAGHGHFYNYVHQLLFTLGFLLSLSAGLEAVLERRGMDRDTAADASRIRCVVDAALFSGLGALIIVHVHDPSPIATYFHTGLGVMLIALGAVILVCAIAHRCTPRDHPACKMMRLVQAFAYILPGGWCMQMAVLIYSGDGGLQQVLMDTNIRASTPLEEAGTFFSLNLLSSALLLAILSAAQGRRGLGNANREKGAGAHRSGRVRPDEDILLPLADPQ